jgi:hypothetical protein
MKRSIGFRAAPWGPSTWCVTPLPHRPVTPRSPVNSRPLPQRDGLHSQTPRRAPLTWAVSGYIALAGILTAPTALAQIPPPPTSSAPNGGAGTSPAPSGQQYVVYVNGNSPLLLAQIQQVEPEAFVNTLDGRSVIQVGRFNALDNAQRRVDELRQLGVGATIQPVAAAVPIVILPPSSSNGYPPTAAVGTGSAGSLPPLPVVAPPTGRSQGQTTGALPLPPNPSTVPVARVEDRSQGTIAATHGYYVVVPGNEVELASLATRITQLGAPASQVQVRRSRLGPHVALGPLTDRTLAEQWSHYLRGSGLNARVHYE